PHLRSRLVVPKNRREVGRQRQHRSQVPPTRRNSDQATTRPLTHPRRRLDVSAHGGTSAGRSTPVVVVTGGGCGWSRCACRWWVGRRGRVRFGAIRWCRRRVGGC